MQCLQKPEEGAGAPGAGLSSGCESGKGCWEENSGPLQIQYVPLNAEPSLQPRDGKSNCFEVSQMRVKQENLNVLAK